MHHSSQIALLTNDLHEAGDTVTVEMHQQNGDRSCANEAIGGAHYGPIIVCHIYFLELINILSHLNYLQVYMAAVSDARTAVGSSANWFKVSEGGLVSRNPAYWAVQVLNVSANTFTKTQKSIFTEYA